MANVIEQLRYLDDQLQVCTLTAHQAELVRVHRLMGLQLRAARLQGECLTRHDAFFGLTAMTLFKMIVIVVMNSSDSHDRMKQATLWNLIGRAGSFV